MLQVLLVDYRAGKMLFIARTVFFTHFEGVENMNLCSRNVDLVWQRGDEIGIELILAALHGHIEPCAAEHFHERLHIAAHFRLSLLKAFLEEAALNLPVPDHRIEQRQQQIRLQLCCKRGCLIKIGAAQYPVVHMDISARRQQPYKRAAQRAAVGRPDMSAAMLTDVCFNFCSFLKHGRKFRVFRLIKAIVADAENAIAVRQQRNDPSKIALPVAAGAGKQ